MAARITDIFSLLLITFLCVGLVEGGYQALEYFVLRPPAEKKVGEKNLPAKEEPALSGEQKKQYDYRVILQRNLFGPPPGKKAPVPIVVPEQTEQVQATSLNIVLMGTIQGADEVERAIILDQSNRKQELYEEGDAIQGAVVKEILRGKVILVYNGRDELLDMSEASKVRPSYKVPVKKLGGVKRRPPSTATQRSAGTAQGNRSSVSSQRTPRRVINRPRAIQPSRVIRKE